MSPKRNTKTATNAKDSGEERYDLFARLGPGPQSFGWTALPLKALETPKLTDRQRILLYELLRTTHNVTGTCMMSRSELAVSLGVDDGSFSDDLAALVLEGYVTRTAEGDLNAKAFLAGQKQYLRVPNWLLRYYGALDLSRRDLTTLFRILFYSTTKDTLAFITQKDLGAALGVKERQVRNVIKSLVERNWLVVVPQTNRYRANRYDVRPFIERLHGHLLAKFGKPNYDSEDPEPPTEPDPPDWEPPESVEAPESPVVVLSAERLLDMVRLDDDAAWVRVGDEARPASLHGRARQWLTINVPELAQDGDLRCPENRVAELTVAIRTQLEQLAKDRDPAYAEIQRQMALTQRLFSELNVVAAVRRFEEQAESRVQELPVPEPLSGVRDRARRLLWEVVNWFPNQRAAQQGMIDDLVQRAAAAGRDPDQEDVVDAIVAVLGVCFKQKLQLLSADHRDGEVPPITVGPEIELWPIAPESESQVRSRLEDLVRDHFGGTASVFRDAPVGHLKAVRAVPTRDIMLALDAEIAAGSFPPEKAAAERVWKSVLKNHK